MEVFYDVLQYHLKRDSGKLMIHTTNPKANTNKTEQNKELWLIS